MVTSKPCATKTWGNLIIFSFIRIFEDSAAKGLWESGLLGVDEGEGRGDGGVRMRGGEQLRQIPSSLRFPVNGNIPGYWNALSVKVSTVPEQLVL